MAIAEWLERNRDNFNIEEDGTDERDDEVNIWDQLCKTSFHLPRERTFRSYRLIRAYQLSTYGGPSGTRFSSVLIPVNIIQVRPRSPL